MTRIELTTSRVIPKGRPGYVRDVLRVLERLADLEGKAGGVTIVAKDFDVSAGWLAQTHAQCDL